MQNENIKKFLKSRLTEKGYQLSEKLDTGLLFTHKRQPICLMIDIDICDMVHYPYISYTSKQNALMYKYEKLFRFSVRNVEDVEVLMLELSVYTEQEPDYEKLKKYGANRQEQAIDPTLPEATFEELFSQAYGESSLYALEREAEYFDYEGKRRFIDYVLKTTYGAIAIELNGETFHHPAVIKDKKYASQLFKQNSLVADGYKVYRWSQRGMSDHEKFILQIKDYFGNGDDFNKTPHFKLLRSLTTFTLAEHQKDALDYIEALRRSGRNTFVIVMPTATGKTEIFIHDYYLQWEKNNSIKALVMVPRRQLKIQTIERFKSRYPKINVGEKFLEHEIQKQNVCVQTYAYVHRHYQEISAETFQYIVVDEAHHAQANGLKTTLEYFNPQNLLGFTATDQRLDRKNLEEIFGQYETRLTLKDAIKQGLVPNISVYRLKTNIDLSEVRFNGKDYVKSDLQKTIQIPSRDEMIARLLKDAFSSPLLEGQALKQGIIFCVDIQHTKRMAKILNQYGLNACSVSGKERNLSDAAMEDYKQHKVQFLCACDLLNEGWDSPQTSILVMARPTLSKVVYVQQLGRGTRHYKDKERLYVIDVVDSYGAMLQPWSVHGLLGITEYRPFADILNQNSKDNTQELEILSGLYENEIKLEPLDIFTLNEQYSDMLSEEQLARELFVSTGTVKQWIKKGEINPDAQLPFGTRQLYFFSEKNLNTIRSQKGLKEHTRNSRKADFVEFLDKRDYTFSYKIVFLCLMFKLANDRGEVDLTQLVNSYIEFYQYLIKNFNKADKSKSPLNNIDYLKSTKDIQRNILQNPFEKFERKRFMYHCKDLNYISFDPYLWEQITQDDLSKIQKQMLTDLENYYNKLDININEKLKEQLTFIEQTEINNNILIADEYFTDFPEESEKYTSYLPFYSLEIAAGGFADSDIQPQPESWVNIEKFGVLKSFSQEYFISQVKGHSMEPLIPDGSYCIFKYGVSGSRTGRIVLAQKIGYEDPDTHASFTIKRYESVKTYNDSEQWTHTQILLKPENPKYPVLEIDPDSAGDFSIIAEFVQVL